MDHSYIEERQIVDRYLMKQLPAGEAVRFEDHYVYCQQCLDQLELAEKLQRGFKRAAAGDAARVAAARRLGVLAWLARSLRSPRAGLVVMALLAVAVLPASLMFRELRRAGRQLDEANAAVTELRRQQAAGTRAGDLESDLAAARAELAGQRRRFEEELGRERSAREGLAGRLARILRPQINTGLFSFSPERGAPPGELDPSHVDPSHIVRLSGDPEWIVLSLELDRIEHDSYRVTLARGKQEVWQRGGLEPNHLDSLALSLHSTWLAAGDYLVRVEAAGPRETGSRPTGQAGEAVPIAHFSFRVIAGG